MSTTHAQCTAAFIKHIRIADICPVGNDTSMGYGSINLIMTGTVVHLGLPLSQWREVQEAGVRTYQAANLVNVGNLVGSNQEHH
jgi:hypothetical protein